MKKIISLVLSLAMVLSMTSVAFAAETADVAVSNGEVTATKMYFGDQEVEVMIATSEDQIVPYANPTNLWYVEHKDLNWGAKVGYNCNVTKGRSLRVWLLVKKGQIEMTVVHPGLVNYVTDFKQTYGTGDRDVETVAKCKDATYQVQFKAVGSEPISSFSILIYETGG